MLGGQFRVACGALVTPNNHRRSVRWNIKQSFRRRSLSSVKEPSHESTNTERKNARDAKQPKKQLKRLAELSAVLLWRRAGLVSDFRCPEPHPTAPWVFFTEQEVITLGSIAVGVKVWCGFQRSVQSPSKFQATKIEIIKD